MSQAAPILPRAVDAERVEFEGRARRLSYYVAGPHNAAFVTPILLLHSINAAASAYEVKPIFDALRRSRQVYALDLPGYGFSDRSQRSYDVRLFVDAVKDMVEHIAERESTRSIDALAISLSAEFLARAATELDQMLRTLTLVTPTGFSKMHGGKPGPPGATRAVPGLYQTLTFPLWRRALFSGLTSRRSIRYFLKRTFGRDDVDGALVEYDYLTTKQPGADRAPFAFVSGRLFSRDIPAVYEQLSMPIWMPHGTKGDFKDFRNADWVENRPNWHVQPYDTGALPHFEIPEVFNADLVRFLDDQNAGPQAVVPSSAEVSASP